MSDLPKSLRADLSEAFELWSTRVVSVRSAEDGTRKLLLRFDSGGETECVLLPGRRHRSICVSTQVGCAMGCRFCASGLAGVDRNLTSGEILEQMARLQQQLKPAERISHMVVMGMGEPLANLDQLLPALDEAHRAECLGISVRRITISTVGIPEGIRRLARHPHHYHLAISLHAPNDSLRDELVPVNRQVTLRRLLEAADAYFEVTRRRLTFEYVLLAGVNDLPEHARQLARLIGNRTALVNLIPYNRVPDLPYRTPSPAATAQFQRLLEEGGLNVQVRTRKGDRIDAACGQLRRATLQ